MGGYNATSLQASREVHMRPPSRSPVERYSRPPSRSPVMFSGGDSPNSRYGRTLGASSAMKSFHERNSSPSLPRPPSRSPVMFSGGDSPNSRYGRTLGASSAMKSFQERNSSPSLSQRPGASPRTGLQRDGVRTGKSQLPTLRPTQDGRQSTPQTVRKDRLAVRPQAQMGEGSATSTGNASPGIASPLPRRLGSPLAGVRESSALMCAPSPTSRANLAQQPHSSSPAPSPLPQNRDAFGAVQAPKPVHHAARAKELIARDVNVTPVAPVNDSTLSNTSASSAARKVLPVKPREHNPQDSNQIDATSRKVKNVAVTKKSTAEMHDEMMKLFNEAKQLGCVIEVRSQSKLHDESEVKETTKVTSMLLSRKKTFEEQHAEMMKLFEEAKALGNVIEVHHRPEDDDLDLSAPTHCPLPSGAILNRIVPGKAQSGKDQSQS